MKNLKLWAMACPVLERQKSIMGMPRMAYTTVTSLPAGVLGVWLPYPMVVMQMME